MRLDDFLSGQEVPFERLPHRQAFTANRIAQLLHVPGKEMAKTVLVRAPRGYFLAVLPATHHVDLARLSQDLHEDEIGLAEEDEIEQIFSDCERGAMPPFGSMYDVETVVDQSLAEDDRIVFEGQDHEEAYRMTFRDFESVEHPRLAKFACR